MVGHRQNGPATELVAEGIQGMGQMRQDRGRSHIAQPERDQTWSVADRESYKPSHIQVMRQQDAFFASGFGENAGVGESLQTLFAQVQGVMAIGT
jgi:hypothetical protein